MSDKLRAAAQAAYRTMVAMELSDGSKREWDTAIAELRAALAETEQEPMLEMNPEKRPWVGLTDREFQPMIQKAMAYYGYDQSEPSHLTAGAGFRVFAYAIEAKLREKNT